MQDRYLNSSESVEQEGIVGGQNVAYVLETKEVSPEVSSKPVGSSLRSLTKWKWKKGRYPLNEEETFANNRFDPGVIQVELELSTARGDGSGLSREKSRSEVRFRVQGIILPFFPLTMCVTFHRLVVRYKMIGTDLSKDFKQSRLCRCHAYIFFWGLNGRQHADIYVGLISTLIDV